MRAVIDRSRPREYERDEEQDLRLVEYYYEELAHIRSGIRFNECGLTHCECKILRRYGLIATNYERIPRIVYLSDYCLRLMRLAEKNLF
jgi:hypothetical protein